MERELEVFTEISGARHANLMVQFNIIQCMDCGRYTEVSGLVGLATLESVDCTDDLGDAPGEAARVYPR